MKTRTLTVQTEVLAYVCETCYHEYNEKSAAEACEVYHKGGQSPTDLEKFLQVLREINISYKIVEQPPMSNYDVYTYIYLCNEKDTLNKAIAYNKYVEFLNGKVAGY